LKSVITGDGTFTLYSEKFSEAMHSDSGAYEEALLKHVRPSCVLNDNKSSVRILDVGFGMGYNTLALLSEALFLGKNIKIEAVCLEYDSSYSDFLRLVKFGDERDELYQKILEAFLSGYYKSEMIDIKLIFGDARKNIKILTGEFDAIFHDPFSPVKNPELWTVEFFKEEFRLLSAGGIITTYSSSSKIRRAMLEAGLCIGKGPSVGRKKEGTLAGKKEINTKLNSEELNKILSNPESNPFRDPEFNLSREDIADRRNKKLK
jgi:tRNA U34 5-methylaminomethyl-2-thiouridine-forming methyltransferase MnmC